MSQLDHNHSTSYEEENLILEQLLSATNGEKDEIIRPPFSICKTENAGRGLVATEAIAKDSEIFMERPLVVGTQVKVKGVACIKCGAKLEPHNLSECSKCGMYCCSPASKVRCSSVPSQHSSEECCLLAKMSKTSKAAFRQNPAWIGLVRIALLSDSEDRGFSLLQDFTHETDYAEAKAQNEDTVEGLVRHLPEILKGKTSKEQLVRSLGVMDANSFRQGDCRRLLYAATSMANHECSPNCRVVFDPQMNAVLTAKCDISPGEPLTIAYCSALKPTQDRRATLRQSKLFWCLCERCRDTTEFGSHLSTLKCPKCKQDSVLPFSFVSPASESGGNLKWECQLDGNVQKLLTALNKGTADEPVKNLEKWLTNVKEQRLGQNHSLVLDLEASVSTKYNRVRTLASFARQLDILKHREKVLSLVDRGRSSRLQGFLAYKRHTLLIELASANQKEGLALDPSLGQDIAESVQTAAKILLKDADCPRDLVDTIKFFQNRQ